MISSDTSGKSSKKDIRKRSTTSLNWSTTESILIQLGSKANTKNTHGGCFDKRYSNTNGVFGEATRIAFEGLSQERKDELWQEYEAENEAAYAAAVRGEVRL